MKRYLYALRYLISIHVLGLILFTAFRLILFLQGYEYLMDEEISVFTRLEAFVRGLWLDNVVASYISILPLVIVSLCSLIGYFGKNLYRGIHIFFSVFYVVAFAISAADIPYFAYFFKHINASIFNWFGYTGTTLGLMFGEFSYIVAFVLFLCLSFPFRLSLPNIITSDLSRYTKSICRKISLETRAAYTPLLDSSNRSMFIRYTRTHGIQPYQSKCGLLLQQYIFEPIGHKPLVQFIA